MSRTSRRNAPVNKITFVRQFNYNGGIIGRTATGEQFVEFPTGTFTPIISKEQGMEFINGIAHKVENRRRRFPTEPKHPEGPYAGYMKNPPTDCNYKARDNDGLWVENVICVFTCKKEKCEVYIKLHEKSKERIKHARGY